jgi:hypothetical protein
LVADNACNAVTAALARRISVFFEQYIRGQSAGVGARGELSHRGRDHGTAEPGHNDQQLYGRSGRKVMIRETCHDDDEFDDRAKTNEDEIFVRYRSVPQKRDCQYD